MAIFMPISMAMGSGLQLSPMKLSWLGRNGDGHYQNQALAWAYIDGGRDVRY
jgi:hypothetical protein